MPFMLSVALTLCTSTYIHRNVNLKYFSAKVLSANWKRSNEEDKNKMKNEFLFSILWQIAKVYAYLVNPRSTLYPMTNEFCIQFGLYFGCIFFLCKQNDELNRKVLPQSSQWYDPAKPVWICECSCRSNKINRQLKWSRKSQKMIW